MSRFSYSQIEYNRRMMIQNRDRYMGKWKATAAAMSPHRLVSSTGNKHDGSNKYTTILKNSAGLALRTFTSGMMTGATPQSRPWFKLVASDGFGNEETLQKRYFSQVEKVISSHFQISNLYRVLPMSYKDVGLFSNSAFAMLPHPRFGFYFYPFAVGSYAFSANHEGNVRTFTRDFTLSVRQIVERYGQLKPNGHIDWDNSLNDLLKELWEEGRYEYQIVMSNTILPNKNPKKDPLFSEDKLYQSYTYMTSTATGIPNQLPLTAQGGARQGKSITGHELGGFLSVRGYDYFPVICPRWEVQAEEDYGVDCPGELALGYVESLQEKEKYKLEAIAKLIKPPMVGPSSLKRHQASILAGGITFVDESAQGQQFKPAFIVDPKVNELMISQADDIRDIDAAFYKDLFLMLAGDKPTSHVTAREIEERASEKLQALAPALGQLDQDQNGPLIENAFIILSSQGKLPDVPRGLEGRQIRPEYISVLAQAAKASMMTSIERVVNFTASAAGAFENPALLKMLKDEQMIRDYAEHVGIDPNLVRDEVEFSQIKQVIQQQQQQAEARNIQTQQAATAKDLSSAKVGEGSMLDEVTG